MCHFDCLQIVLVLYIVFIQAPVGVGSAGSLCSALIIYLIEPNTFTLIGLREINRFHSYL